MATFLDRGYNLVSCTPTLQSLAASKCTGSSCSNIVGRKYIVQQR